MSQDTDDEAADPAEPAEPAEPDEQSLGIVAGMETIIGYIESYRSLLEGRGFTRWAAETMAIRYHENICAELDRQRVLAFARQERFDAAQRNAGLWPTAVA